MRRRRMWVAVIVLWSLAFAQAAVAAHACSMLASAAFSPEQVMTGDAQPMPPGCNGMAKRTGSTGNVCQSHCLAGQQVHGQADIPTASIAPLPALIVHVTFARTPAASFMASSLTALAAAPPPQLRFSRFLI